MRPVFTIILILVFSNLRGQTDFSLDTSRRAIDSIYNALGLLSEGIRNHGVDVPKSIMTFNSEIKTYGKDSAAILFFTDNGRLLFKSVNKYDGQKYRRWERSEIYNSSGELVYFENWKWSCLDSNERTDPHILYFDAMLYEKGRFVYDSLGRLSERLFWHISIGGVRKYIYSYDRNNGQTYVLSKGDERLFWE